MEIGSEWRGWTVVEYLGGGSFGKVYKIEREEFGYKYEAALKVIRIPHSYDEVSTALHEGMTEDSVDAYFYSVVKGISSELALLSQLSGNSNIVSYEDHSVVKLMDEFGWEIYLRMELAVPLYEHLKNRVIRVRDVIQIGVDICKALETCERNNIIHRDIKPDNIFYSKQGTYKLGDFGIARKLDSTTAHMTKIGTFSYMAPEVYRGQQYDRTVDVYSLGLILYQFMNRNRRPFLPPYPDNVTMEDNETANTKRLTGISLPRPCAADDKLSEIILKACANSPEDRYQHAEDLRHDLEAVLSDSNADCIIFNDLSDDKTRDMSPDDSSIKNETATMFTTEIGQLFTSEQEPGETGRGEPCTVYAAHKDQKIKEVPEKDVCTDSQKEESKYNHKYLMITLICVAIIVGGSLFGYHYFNPTVPDVIGKDKEDAEAILTEAGLKVGEVKDAGDFSEIEQGCIEYQSEDAGKRIKRGTAVSLTVSLGEGVKVPDLKDMTYDEAVKTAKEHNLIVDNEKLFVWHDTVKKGHIVKQEPGKGKTVPEGTAIKVTESKGIEKIKVPDTVGSDVETAIKRITDSKLEENVITQISYTVAAGKVISQSPAAESTVKKGTVVNLYVSSGKPARTNSNNNRSKAKKKSRNKGKSKYSNAIELK